jgi:hypothetical protein
VYLSTAEKDSESKIADQLSYKTTQASSTERLKLEEPDLLHGSRQNAKHDMKEVYRLALDAFIPLGDGLTNHMKYLALELNSLEGISAEDKEDILNDFNKYGVDVLDTTLEQLEQEGRVGEARSIKGVLLRVKSTEVTDNKVVVRGFVYKSAKGGVGTRCTIHRWEMASNQSHSYRDMLIWNVMQPFI